ncbi:hypothetical protein HFD91_15835 [Enterobacteriaceae bacterium EKM102V]|uniref:hypothetical protein n=1 Tax=Pantoea TaxID=53335 RepID=UPI00142E38A4|nr:MULTISPECIES: hypothetical protein [Pantoea]KAF6657436.1 hypothetical protein HFD91_15835 [Enterobacteriaceae bacterium EKM102V]KAF6666241.1 hypothetical protein HFD97_14910 [Pantoea sp. EKM103V]
MNPDNKPLIYLLNTPATVVKKLNAVFNANHYWMNGYSEYEAASYRPLEVSYSSNLPSNLHEAEIVVIDTGLRNQLIKGRSSIKVIYNHTPSFIDLFPLDMNRALTDVFSTEKFQLLFIFCESYNEETYILQNEAGQHSQYQTNTYCFPNYYGFKPARRRGSRMNIVEGKQAIEIKQCLERYLPNSNYNFVFNLIKGDKSTDVPLLRNEAGEDVCFIRKMGSKLVFFLPEIYDKPGFLFDLFNNVLPDIGFSKEIFPNHGNFKWIKYFDYISLEERNKIIDIENEKSRHQEALSSLQKEYERVHSKEENIKLRAMLKETGDDLVSAVKWFLEYIGFANVVDPDKDVDVNAGEVFEEDLNFEQNGIHFLLEVKGIGGNSTDAQCAQISKIALRRKKANPGNTYKAVYIVNHRRYKAPKEREPIPFNENQITDAEIANRGMTFTYELFNIYHMIESGVISKEAARETFKQEGLLDFRQSLHRLEFNHCYDRVVVYSLRIPADSNFTVSRVDKIAIQDSENHWHLLNIESIEIDRVPYDAVNSGTVGIKVDRIVPGARDYYVVKVSKDKGLQDA